MSTITFSSARPTASMPSGAPSETTSSEARLVAGLITAEIAAENESRRIRRATERHRERIAGVITIAACSFAGAAAFAFAQLLLVVR